MYNLKQLYKTKIELRQLKEEKDKIEMAFRRRTEGYIITAFGIVAGLAWNEAVKALMGYLFPIEKDTILVKFLYAIIMTAVLVLMSLYVVRFINKKDDKKEIQDIKQ